MVLFDPGALIWVEVGRRAADETEAGAAPGLGIGACSCRDRGIILYGGFSPGGSPQQKCPLLRTIRFFACNTGKWGSETFCGDAPALAYKPIIFQFGGGLVVIASVPVLCPPLLGSPVAGAAQRDGQAAAERGSTLRFRSDVYYLTENRAEGLPPGAPPVVLADEGLRDWVSALAGPTGGFRAFGGSVDRYFASASICRPVAIRPSPGPERDSLSRSASSAGRPGDEAGPDAFGSDGSAAGSPRCDRIACSPESCAVQPAGLQGESPAEAWGAQGALHGLDALGLGASGASRGPGGSCGLGHPGFPASPAVPAAASAGAHSPRPSEALRSCVRLPARYPVRHPPGSPWQGSPWSGAPADPVLPNLKPAAGKRDFQRSALQRKAGIGGHAARDPESGGAAEAISVSREGAAQDELQAPAEE